MSDGLNRRELLAEIRRLNQVLEAQNRVIHRLVDKATAAHLYAQRLRKKLEGKRGN